MYKIISGGEVIAICDKPRFVKVSETSGTLVRCEASEATGIVVGGEYHSKANTFAVEIDGGEYTFSVDRRVKESEDISKTVFAVLAENETLPEEKILNHPEVFEEWQPDTSYSIGNIRQSDGELYRCKQAHTSQAIYPPSIVPALWEKIARPGEYREIKDNMSAIEAFHLDEIGWYKTKDNLWKSKQEGNVYTPVTWPQGWEKV